MILIVSPAAPDSVHGNGVTARRWAAVLESLGHRVRLSQHLPEDGDFDALVALHARKSADAVRRFRARHPKRPIVIGLTGTDLYPDLRSTGVDPAVLALANRFVVLQPLGVEQLDPQDRPNARVIIQSLPQVQRRTSLAGVFEVVQLAHLRAVKDPLRLAAAVRHLPADSLIRVSHLGAAMEPELAAEAAAESAGNPRYDWLGPRPRDEALAVLARSRLLALTSLHEGGANVVSEALAAGVPVVSSAIPGSIGLLGEDYPGYFPAGDTGALTELLRAVEQDRDGLYRQLQDRCAALRPIVDPQRERRSWADLLAELELPVRA